MKGLTYLTLIPLCKRGIKIISSRRPSPPHRASSPPYEQPMKRAPPRQFLIASNDNDLSEIDFYETSKRTVLKSRCLYLVGLLVLFWSFHGQRNFAEERFQSNQHLTSESTKWLKRLTTNFAQTFLTDCFTKVYPCCFSLQHVIAIFRQVLKTFCTREIKSRCF